MRGGPDRAGDAYIVLGSVAGTAPPIALGGGAFLPLVPDAYTDLTLAVGAPIAGALGVLGPDGDGTATFALDAGTATAFAGVTVFHAVLTVDLTDFAMWGTDAVGVALVP